MKAQAMADTTSPDTEAPKLTFLKIPDVIDLEGDDYFHFITAGATDAGAGVAGVTVHTDLPVNSPAYSSLFGFFVGPTVQLAGHVYPIPQPDYTPWQSGSYTADVLFNTNGSFNITSVDVRDQAGNLRTYSSAELGALQVNTSFQVINSASYGSAAADTMTGTAIDNTMSGLGGNDVLNGGGGNDLVVYDARRQHFGIAREGDAVVVTDARGVDGTDRLYNIERIWFDDMVVDFNPESVVSQLVRLYRAAFNRDPDSAGLTYWAAELEGYIPTTTLAQVAQGFVASSEFQNLYSYNNSNDFLVQTLYYNVLGRDGSVGDIAYWRGVLDRKEASVADVLVAFSESAEHKAATAELIGNGINYDPAWMV